MTKKTSSEIREAIIALHKKKVSKKEIASLLKLNKNTVTLWVKRYETEGNVKQKWRPHSARCTTDEDDQRIVDYVVNTPRAQTTCSAIKANLALECSTRTIRRRMKEKNILHHIPSKKTKKNNEQEENNQETHIEQGVQYALDYVCNDNSFWTKVSTY